MKHTPGPWKLLTEGEDDDFTTRTIIIDGPPRNLSEVCIVTTGSFSDDVEAANARLISAAPQLLSALELSLQRLEAWEKGHGDIDRYKNSDHYRQIEYAINKAKGI